MATLFTGEGKMKALSIKQPWAWLICAGYKDVENRNWSLHDKGIFLIDHNWQYRIYVHAGKKVDDAGAIWLWENKERLGIQGCMLRWTDICNFWKESAIIGEVSITACITESYPVKSPWFIGKYGFMLDNPVLYDKPIPYRGQLGFFEVQPPQEK